MHTNIRPARRMFFFVRRYVSFVILWSMWNTGFTLKVLGFVAAAGAASAGIYEVAKIYSVQSLKTTVEEQIRDGNYLAALAAVGQLKDAGVNDPALADTAARTARLLVAEDAFHKAQAAAAEKRFADAGALLRGSDALLPAFKYYDEAQALYAEVEAAAAAAAHEAAVTLLQLENKTDAEKKRRTAAEQAADKLAGTLKEKDAALTTAAQDLKNAQQETEAKQAALAEEQARTKALAAEMEQATRQKFFTELRTYADIAKKGKTQLDNAVLEVNAGRDVTALVYVSQGKILFEEVQNKAADLRNNRTLSPYQDRVDDLLAGLANFLESAKELRNTVVYIEERGSSNFTAAFNRGAGALADGTAHLERVFEALAGN